MRAEQEGPPKEETAGPGAPPPETPTSYRASLKTSRTDRNDVGQRCGRNAPAGLHTPGFREGFRRGAQDALRAAGRHLPPETWHIIEALADQYELAGSDG